MKTHGGVLDRDRYILMPGTIIAGHQVQRDGSWVALKPGTRYRHPASGSIYLMREDGTMELLKTRKGD